MQTFLKNGYIVSMDQNDTVFDGGGVLVENDRITAVGRVDPAKISPDAEVIDLRGLIKTGLIELSLVNHHVALV